MAAFISLFGGSKRSTQRPGVQLLEEQACPPGRDERIPDAPQEGDAHFVKGTTLIGPYPDKMRLAMFGFGCYWCSEGIFMHDSRIYCTAVGFAGGVTKNPTYREVCSGSTNHNEVLRIVYDPDEVGILRPRFRGGRLAFATAYGSRWHRPRGVGN